MTIRQGTTFFLMTLSPAAQLYAILRVCNSNSVPAPLQYCALCNFPG